MSVLGHIFFSKTICLTEIQNYLGDLYYFFVPQNISQASRFLVF